MNERVTEDQHGARRALWAHQTAARCQWADDVTGHGPQRIARGGDVQRRRGWAVHVGAPDEVQRTVELGDLVEEDVQVEGQRLGYPVLVVVRGEVVVPLPLLAGEGLLGVDLHLLDVQLVDPEELPGGFHEARVTNNRGEHVISQVQAHRGADDVSGLLPEVLRPALVEQPRQPSEHRLNLTGREQSGQDEQAITLERCNLLVGQPHGPTLASGPLESGDQGWAAMGRAATFRGIRATATPATDEAFGLAEGPVWDLPTAGGGRLLWVDIDAGAVYTGAVSEGRVAVRRRFVVDRTVGCVIPGPDGTLAVGASRDLRVVDGQTGAVVRSLALPTPAGSRLNDGACDPAGRLIVGSLALDGRRGREVLMRVEHDGTITVLDDDLTLSNGLGWSPDGRTMYSVDSVPGVVWSRPYEAASGRVGRRSVLIDLAGVSPGGGPDGLCVDADGMVWVAVWGVGEVRRYNPEGEQIGVVEVDAPHTSSVTFAGDDLSTMVITTSCSQLSAADRDRYPLSGRLFIAQPGVAGLPSPTWAGL